MRFRRLPFLAALWSTLILGAFCIAAEPTGRFIVHEWGTFTTYSGSNGVHLDFRPLQDHELPGFVVDRASQSGTLWLGKGRIKTRVRMETPVTYFYTDQARTVKASVTFPRGLLTEFYPPVANMEPRFDRSLAMGRDGEPVGHGKLDWGEIDLLPLNALKPGSIDPSVAEQIARHVDATLPPDADGNHYAAARRTDSALVHVRLPKRDPLMGFELSPPSGDFYEKFLFYRGVGKFDVPVKVENPSGERFLVSNTGTAPIPRMLVLHVQGDVRRFGFTQALEAGQSRELVSPQTEISWDDLRALVTQELIGTGLYEKEALAMVDTWSTSWFTEQGLRLFYLVPQKLTDEVLPLTITPQPDAQLRVMVGRVEIMSVSQEQHLLNLVKTSAQERRRLREEASERNEPAPLPSIPQELVQMGRFAEPALARVRDICRDASIEQEIDNLIWQIKQAEANAS